MSGEGVIALKTEVSKREIFLSKLKDFSESTALQRLVHLPITDLNIRPRLSPASYTLAMRKTSRRTSPVI